MTGIAGSIGGILIPSKCVACGPPGIRQTSLKGHRRFVIEAAFWIQITEDDAMELYDMHLDEAARKIMEMRGRLSAPIC